MKRSEFLRLSLLALVGSGLRLSPQPIPISTPKIKVFYFKVSAEMLSDSVAFETLYNDLIKRYCRGTLISKEIGYESDDFAKNLFTVVLKHKI